MSLYRTYRPRTFADVVGQDHVVTTLERAAKQEKLSHAYLFAGSRGTGKTSVARILAKVLMLQGIEDEKIAQQIAKGVEEGTIVDLLEIDAASNRGIDDIRDLVEKIQFSPVVASAKVYIIDEVHMLTKEAFNALLKTLEEPPPYAYFILATTELTKIPATIQSRCQRFPFHRIREEDIVRRLQYIADQEHIAVEREALRAIARHVEGGLRDAVSLLDQMRALPKVTVRDVEERIGGTGQEHIDAVVTALEERNAQSLVSAVRKLEEEGVPLENFLQRLLAMVRQHLHEAIEHGEPPEPFVRLLDQLLGAARDVRSAPVPGLALEAALLSLCLSEERRSAEAPLKLGSGEKKKSAERAGAAPPVAAGAAEKELPESSAEKAPEAAESDQHRKGAATFEAPEVTLESIRDAWPAILEQTAPPAVKMSLKNGSVLTVESGKVTVAFSSSFHRDKVAQTEAARRVEEVMERIFRRSLRLECVLEESTGNGNGVQEEAVNLAEAAAEIF